SLARPLHPELVKRGLEQLLQRRNGETSITIAHLASFLPSFAKRLGMDNEAIAKLKQFAAKLRVEKRGLAERHRETLRRFDDPAAVEALVNLPSRILRDVARSGRCGMREAKRVQTALAIELLLVAAVRIANLSAIEIDRHFVVVQQDPKVLHLHFPKDEVKNRENLEFPLPAETTALRDLYLAQYRPLLPHPESPFLFSGKKPGRPKPGAALTA